MSWGDYGGWRPHVPASERRARASKKIDALRKKGRVITPVEIAGRTIARTFWGQAWCRNLESYSDFANRLPRGRAYVRNGSVVDLQVGAGRISALVMGSDLYTVEIAIDALRRSIWNGITDECAGKIDSLVELLEGRLSKGVMEIVTRKSSGLFPAPREIRMSCSCPDWAGLCKHLAAVLYGVGARLDHEPRLLFLLRKVDEMELVSRAAAAPLAASSPAAEGARGLDESALSGIFGIDLDGGTPSAPAEAAGNPPEEPSTRSRRKGARHETKNAGAGKRAKSRGTMTSSELTARGVSPSTVQNWLMEGVLLRTAVRGAYRTTPETDVRMARYLVRKRSRKT